MSPVSAGQPLRVLLFSPRAGRDPLSGDTSYTESLLAAPPSGVEYVPYDVALADGSLVELGRRPARGRAFQLGLFVLRVVEVVLRRSGLMFREPVWWVRIEPGRFDLVHQHLFSVRQVGPQIPVVSSAGYPLSTLYERRDGWSRRRTRVATWMERQLARKAGVLVPWLHASSPDDVMTVYSAAFRRWLERCGDPADDVRVVGTTLTDHTISAPGDRTGRGLAFVGRDFSAKGGDVALGAFSLLRAADPGWRLVVVTTEEAGRRIPPTPGLEVRWGQSREQVLDLLAATDILLAPTRSDCGVPYALLEALRAGTCVVTSDLEWLDERLGGPGVLRVSTEPEAVAAAVADLAEDLPTAARGARTCFEEHFRAPDALEDGLGAAYQRAVAAVAPRPAGVLVVAPRRDVERNPFDGFAVRHRSVISALAGTTRVVLAVVDAGGDNDLDLDLEGVEVVRAPTPRPPGGRLARLRAAAGLAAGAPDLDAVEWSSLILDSRCDVALTVGPWLQAEYAPVWRRLPAVHLFEEDLMRVAALAPQSRRARSLRRVEALLQSLSKARPAHVVAISEPEVRRARSRFPRSAVSCVPFGVDPSEWLMTREPSEGVDVLVVGNFSEDRNAEGLCDVLQVVERSGRGPAIRIRSGPGLSPSLMRFVEAGLLTVDEGGTVREAYGRAWAALVPAKTVTGQKTTILQAWASGVPVVSTTACAATVAAPHALLEASNAEGLLDHLERLRQSPGDRLRLARAGHDVVASRHSLWAQDSRVVELLRALPRG